MCGVCKVRARSLFRASGAQISFACRPSGFLRLTVQTPLNTLLLFCYVLQITSEKTVLMQRFAVMFLKSSNKFINQESDATLPRWHHTRSLYVSLNQQCCQARLIGRWGTPLNIFILETKIATPARHGHISTEAVLQLRRRAEAPKCQMGAGDECSSLHLWKMSSHQHDAPKIHPLGNYSDPRRTVSH